MLARRLQKKVILQKKNQAISASFLVFLWTFYERAFARIPQTILMIYFSEALNPENEPGFTDDS